MTRLPLSVRVRIAQAAIIAAPVPAVVPREIRIVPVTGVDGGTRWIWVCPCHERRSAPWVDRPTVKAAWAEHDQFPPAKVARSEPVVFL